MNLFGIQINFGGSSTLDEIEEADSQYNELRANADHDGADDLAEEMHGKGFLPHWDRDNQTWYFVDPHAD
jgi:hypothetical protein